MPGSSPSHSRHPSSVTRQPTHRHVDDEDSTRTTATGPGTAWTTGTATARVARAAALLAAGALVITAAWLLRDPSGDLVQTIVPTTVDLPGVTAVSEVAVVLLGLACAVAGWQALRRGGAALALAVAAGAGVVAAYAASEGLKALVQADRVCRDIGVVDCPGEGSWGFPSNHTTIAVAGATAVVLLVRSTWPRWVQVAVVVLAVLGGVGRVLQGVHAPHEVVAGAALGTVVVLVVVLLAAPVLASPAVVRRLDALSSPLRAR